MATIRKLPSGKWNVQIRKRGQKPITKTFRTKVAAESWAKKTESDIERGSFKDLVLADKTTIIELLEKYQKIITPRKASAQREISRIKTLKKYFKGRSVSSLAPPDIIDFIDARLQTVSNVTVNKELNTLKLAIDAGSSLWGIHVQDNVVSSARGILARSGRTLTEKPRERRLEKWELKRILKASHPPLRALIIWALESAMRRGEIANMKKSHKQGHLLRIPITKTGKPRIIPFTKHMERIWSDFPFGIAPDSITQAFERAATKAGITDLRFHDLRHEATSRLFEKGLQMEEVAAITGHADWSSLKRYTHPDMNLIHKKLSR